MKVQNQDKRIMGSRKNTFGNVRDIPSNVEESREIPFVNSTAQRDRHGTVLNQDNWNLDNYRKNPVVTYMHSGSGGLFSEPNPDYIIGRDKNPHIEGTGADKKLIGLLQFEPNDINPLAEKIFRKVLFGTLSKSSVGFIETGQGEYGKGDQARRGSDETYYFAGQELLEWSIVNIPSNPNTGKRKIRLLGDEPVGVQCYALQQLSDRFRPGYLEKLSVNDILVLLDGKDLGIHEKDPDKVREMLADPKAIADRIEFERLAFRKGKEARSLIEKGPKNETNNFTTLNISTMKKFSLLEAIQTKLSRGTYDKESLSVFDQGADAMREAGLIHLAQGNNLLIPIQERAALPSSAIFGTQPLYALPPAAEQTVFAKAGATIVTGLNAKINVPCLSVPIVAWGAENADSGNDTGSTLNSISLSPLRLTAWFDVSSLILVQSSPSASKLLEDNLIGATAQKLEATILGVAARSATQMQGMGYKVTIGTDTGKATVVPTFANILAMETEVASWKALLGNLGFITSPKGKTTLKSLLKVPNTQESLMEKGLINEYPVFISQFASDIAGSDGLGSLLIFGNWADLIITQFGSYMITLDPYTLAKWNRTRITIDSFWDCKGMRFASTSTGDGTDPDEYHGFSSLPIKAS